MRKFLEGISNTMNPNDSRSKQSNLNFFRSSHIKHIETSERWDEKMLFEKYWGVCEVSVAQLGMIFRRHMKWLISSCLHPCHSFMSILRMCRFPFSTQMSSFSLLLSAEMCRRKEENLFHVETIATNMPSQNFIIKAMWEIFERMWNACLGLGEWEPF